MMPQTKHYKRKDRQAVARKLMKGPQGEFTQTDLNKVDYVPKWMSRAFRNNWYTVMVADNTPTTHGDGIRVMVQRHDDLPIKNHWSEMQNIKNKIFGKEVTAVEYYPAESKLIDKHNIYWFWVFPEGVLPIPL